MDRNWRRYRDQQMSKSFCVQNQVLGPNRRTEVKMGHTEWKLVKPGIYTYSSTIDVDGRPLTNLAYKTKMKEEWALPPSREDRFAEDFIKNLEEKLERGEGPVSIPFLVYTRIDDGMKVPNVECDFEVEMNELSLYSRYFMGFPGCPVTFYEHKEGFDAPTGEFNYKFGYRNVFFVIKKKFVKRFKERLFREVFGTRQVSSNTNNSSLQQLIEREKLFVSPRKLEEWNIPCTATLCCRRKDGTFRIRREGEVVWGFSTGWNITQAIFEKDNSSVSTASLETVVIDDENLEVGSAFSRI